MFVASLAQGRIPQGARPLRGFREHAQAAVDEARLGFALVQERDNGLGDLDPRAGHITMELDDSRDGGYRRHRYEAFYEGTAEDGTVFELRRFPADGGSPALADGSWTRLEGQSMTHASYLQLEGEGKVEYASFNHVDAHQPERSRAAGWTTGFEAAALEQTSEWRLLD